ncbi:hypothetical protein QBC37DRAFT_455686 [Rhypophila decipiens]|uniref:EF-hand domain-containing protein n=1 Tax=Rhypophila decipiens TaxID=261697 RepID=A0AAN6XV04_9PEZI|nr:hypothetical protein QBC37DRAFT_455686 [Rhypophila decipiens]
MTGNTYICNVCNAALFPDRARIHCLICPKYDSCADCHITRSVLGTHRLEHDFAVYRHDRQVLPAGDEPEQTAVRSEDVNRPDDRIVYWGNLLTPAKTTSAIFSRLVKAIFAHFDATCSGALQPSEFCALLSAAGFTAEQFPPLKVSPGSASPADLHEVDSWLANWMQSFPLDYSMTTRRFPPPPPIEPVNGRIRMRDQLLHALMYPEPPVVTDGKPLLTPLGLEQFFLHALLHDPGELSVTLNQLLCGLPRLTDPETGRLFEAQAIPRSCFPSAADPEAEEKRMKAQAMELRAEHDAHMGIMRGMFAASGGCLIDENGTRHYSSGL